MPICFNYNKFFLSLPLLTIPLKSFSHSAIQLQLKNQTSLEIINASVTAFSPEALYASDPEQLLTTLFLEPEGEYKTTIDMYESINLTWEDTTFTALKPDQQQADWLFFNGFCQTFSQVRVIYTPPDKYLVIPKSCESINSQPLPVWTFLRLKRSAPDSKSSLPFTAKHLSPASVYFAITKKTVRPYLDILSEPGVQLPSDALTGKFSWLDAIAQHQGQQVLSINYANIQASTKSPGSALLNQLIANATSLEEITWLIGALSGNSLLVLQDDLLGMKYMKDGRIIVQSVLSAIKKERLKKIFG